MLMKKQVSVSVSVTCYACILSPHSDSSSGRALFVVRNLRGSALRPGTLVPSLLALVRFLVRPSAPPVQGVLHA